MPRRRVSNSESNAAVLMGKSGKRKWRDVYEVQVSGKCDGKLRLNFPFLEYRIYCEFPPRLID